MAWSSATAEGKEEDFNVTRFGSPEAMKWVTREKAKVGRFACPWLIRRFVDREAEFVFVPAAEVRVAEELGGIPFELPGVDPTHYSEGEREFVGFDFIARKHGLKYPALLMLARIVRGADARIHDPQPESAGLEAAAIGFRVVAKDDHDNMRLQFPLYDALYEYCKGSTAGKGGLVHSNPSG